MYKEVAMIALVLSTILLPRPLDTSAQPAGEAKITLAISIAKERQKVGEPLRLRVEIANAGRTPVFVGSEIMNIAGWIYSLQFDIADSKGKHHGTSTLLPPFVPLPKDTFTEALVRNWIPIQPGHFYGTTLTLDEPILTKPGRYKLSAMYKCLGMNAPLYYNVLAAHPEEVEKLPFKAWEGSVESNSIWIEITN